METHFRCISACLQFQRFRSEGKCKVSLGHMGKKRIKNSIFSPYPSSFRHSEGMVYHSIGCRKTPSQISLSEGRLISSCFLGFQTMATRSSITGFWWKGLHGKQMHILEEAAQPTWPGSSMTTRGRDQAPDMPVETTPLGVYILQRRPTFQFIQL